MTGVFASTVVAGLLVAVGLMGTVAPVLPGVVVIYAGMVLYAFATGWDAWAITLVAIATVLVGLNAVLGVRIPAAATSEVAGRRSLWIGAVGGIVGFFVIPVVGLPVGWIAGVFLSELSQSTFPAARSATWTIIRSFGRAAVVQFAIGLVMALLWGAWATFEMFG